MVPLGHLHGTCAKDLPSHHDNVRRTCRWLERTIPYPRAPVPHPQKVGANPPCTYPNDIGNGGSWSSRAYYRVTTWDWLTLIQTNFGHGSRDLAVYRRLNGGDPLRREMLLAMNQLRLKQHRMVQHLERCRKPLCLGLVILYCFRNCLRNTYARCVFACAV